ncbi:hypothetical protein BO223_09545 [Faecalibaculum rodentium]|uniref:Uncharacterized protein n=1 Tax=Faecalibaculum rodentium TaxID=1702221 RepID=A0A1Q9YIH2_9FIRM|nr:hypothetical protein BO223_09545 [Faecalibaculum rodentium]
MPDIARIHHQHPFQFQTPGHITACPQEHIAVQGCSLAGHVHQPWSLRSDQDPVSLQIQDAAGGSHAPFGLQRLPGTGLQIQGPSGSILSQFFHAARFLQISGCGNDSHAFSVHTQLSYVPEYNHRQKTRALTGMI